MTTDAAGYPVSLDIQRDASQNRITNFPLFIGTFIRSILLIPHYIILFFVGIVAIILYFIATFAILFSGKYPAGFFAFIENYLRWYTNANSYLLHLYDKYPPFTGSQTGGYPLTLTVPYVENASRILNLPLFIGMLIRLILLIPHLVVVYFLILAMYIVVFIAQFAILFTGNFPEGMHNFAVGVTRWSTRVTAYVFGLSDNYPPFSTS